MPDITITLTGSDGETRTRSFTINDDAHAIALTERVDEILSGDADQVGDIKYTP